MKLPLQDGLCEIGVGEGRCVRIGFGSFLTLGRRDGVRGLGFSEQLYRALLFVFPAQFRRAYAADAVELFRDRYREEYRRAGDN